MLGALAALCAVLVTMSSASAAALEWDAPPGCLSQEQAEAALRSMVDLREAHGMSVRIDRFATAEWRARIDVADASAPRVLYGADCRELGQAALLVLELALPDHPQRKTDSIDAPHRIERLQTFLQGFGTFDSGALPGSAYGLGAAAAFRFRGLQLELLGSGSFTRDVPLANHPPALAEISLISATLRSSLQLFSPARRNGHLRVAPSAAIELGSVRGRTRHLEDSQRARGLWASALAGLLVSFERSVRVRPQLALELSLPFRRPAFDVQGLGTLFQAAPVGVRASLGIMILLF